MSGIANAVSLHRPGHFTTPAQEMYLEGVVHFGKKVHLRIFLVLSPEWQELLAEESILMVGNEKGIRCCGMG